MKTADGFYSTTNFRWYVRWVGDIPLLQQRWDKFRNYGDTVTQEWRELSVYIESAAEEDGPRKW